MLLISIAYRHTGIDTKIQASNQFYETHNSKFPSFAFYNRFAMCVKVATYFVEGIHADQTDPLDIQRFNDPPSYGRFAWRTSSTNTFPRDKYKWQIACSTFTQGGKRGIRNR